MALPVRRFRAGVWQEAVDSIAAEIPVALSYNSIPHVVMMATPCDLEDMGVGFTVSEGLVADYSELRDVVLDTSSGDHELRLSVTGSRLGELLQRRRNLTGRTGLRSLRGRGDRGCDPPAAAGSRGRRNLA